MKKIAAFSYSARNWGGSFQYSLSIVHALQESMTDKFDLCFFYTEPDCDDLGKDLGFKSVFVRRGRLLFKLIRLFCRCFVRLFPDSFWKRWSYVDEVSYAIWRYKPDVCICLNQIFIPLPAKAIKIAPIHDLMHRYQARFAEVGTADEYVYREFVVHNFIKYYDILVDSDVGKAQVLECYRADADRIHVLPFIPSPLLHNPSQRPKALDGIIFKPFVVYPAQFWPHKNHQTLVRALKLLHNRHQVHAVFCGAKKQKGFEELQSLVKELGLNDYVHFIGYVADVELKWLYQNALCMVMPTFFGPTNIPPLEAMQYGCPVATSGIFGIPAQLGKAALYFDPNDPQEISQCIKKILTDENTRSSLVEEGYLLCKNWNEDAFKERFSSIFRRIIDRNPNSMQR